MFGFLHTKPNIYQVTRLALYHRGESVGVYDLF